MTGKQQQKYDFRLDGNTVRFQPKGKAGAWKGEVRLDAADGHPVYVSSDWAHRVPAWARVAFGTNFRQVGFAATYRKVADGVWFPATFGTEFRLRVLYGYARTVTISLTNSDFRRASADSTIRYEVTEKR